VIVDEDLSRSHAEVHRGWDGVTVADLGSKNGTRVNGSKVGATPVVLTDGQAITLGGIVFRFRDPAERHLRGDSLPEDAPAPRVVADAPAAASTIPWTVVGYAAIIVVAIGALIWILIG
jgi:pSer/pThr/pTyr-binding forkhead associated (FHA) protein